MKFGFFHRVSVVVDNITDMPFMAKSIALVLAFMAPIRDVVGVMMFFLVMDTLSAIYLRYRKVKDRKCDDDDPTALRRIKCVGLFWRVVDRDKFTRTVEKFFAYPAIALTCFIFDVMVLGIRPNDDGLILRFSLTNFSFVLICMMDFRSFLRNMGKATGNDIYGYIEKVLEKKVFNKTKNGV